MNFSAGSWQLQPICWRRLKPVHWIRTVFGFVEPETVGDQAATATTTRLVGGARRRCPRRAPLPPPSLLEIGYLGYGWIGYSSRPLVP